MNAIIIDLTSQNMHSAKSKIGGIQNYLLIYLLNQLVLSSFLLQIIPSIPIDSTAFSPFPVLNSRSHHPSFKPTIASKQTSLLQILIPLQSYFLTVLAVTF